MAPSTAEDQLQLLGLGVGALWKRASPTIGPITLGAIANRVLHTVAGASATLGAIKVGDTGLDISAAVEWTRIHGDEPELDRTVRAVLIELLTVLGNVTGHILVAPLHEVFETLIFETLTFENRSRDALSRGAHPREKDKKS